MCSPDLGGARSCTINFTFASTSWRDVGTRGRGRGEVQEWCEFFFFVVTILLLSLMG